MDVGWRVGVDRVRHLVAREPRLADRLAAVRRQPHRPSGRRRPGARRARRARTHLRRHEFPRLLWHVRRQRLLPRLREYRSLSLARRRFNVVNVSVNSRFSGVTIGRARRAVHAGPALWGAQNLPDAVF